MAPTNMNDSSSEEQEKEQKKDQEKKTEEDRKQRLLMQERFLKEEERKLIFLRSQEKRKLLLQRNMAVEVERQRLMDEVRREMIRRQQTVCRPQPPDVSAMELQRRQHAAERIRAAVELIGPKQDLTQRQQQKNNAKSARKQKQKNVHPAEGTRLKQKRRSCAEDRKCSVSKETSTGFSFAELWKDIASPKKTKEEVDRDYQDQRYSLDVSISVTETPCSSRNAMMHSMRAMSSELWKQEPATMTRPR